MRLPIRPNVFPQKRRFALNNCTRQHSTVTLKVNREDWQREVPGHMSRHCPGTSKEINKALSISPRIGQNVSKAVLKHPPL
jgi:hypothetical protein